MFISPSSSFLGFNFKSDSVSFSPVFFWHGKLPAPVFHESQIADDTQMNKTAMKLDEGLDRDWILKAEVELNNKFLTCYSLDIHFVNNKIYTELF